MTKLLKKYNVLTRPMIIAFLVIISLVMTTSTFAYWAIEIESAEMSTQNFIQLGTQLDGTTWYEVINEEEPCEYVDEFLIPHDRLLNSDDIDAYEVLYTICEIKEAIENNETQTFDVDYEIVIYKNGKLANNNFYNKIIEYINVEISPNNPFEVGDTPYEFSYTITLDEDIPQKILNKFSKAEIYITFDYEID